MTRIGIPGGGITANQLIEALKPLYDVLERIEQRLEAIEQKTPIVTNEPFKLVDDEPRE